MYWNKMTGDSFMKSAITRHAFFDIYRALYHVSRDTLDLMTEELNKSFMHYYVPSKPNRWGLKYYAMVDDSAYCLRFKPHRKGISLVLRELCNDFISSLDPTVANYCVFADNYFGMHLKTT